MPSIQDPLLAPQSYSIRPNPQIQSIQIWKARDNLDFKPSTKKVPANRKRRNVPHWQFVEQDSGDPALNFLFYCTKNPRMWIQKNTNTFRKLEAELESTWLTRLRLDRIFDYTALRPGLSYLRLQAQISVWNGIDATDDDGTPVDYPSDWQFLPPIRIQPALSLPPPTSPWRMEKIVAVGKKEKEKRGGPQSQSSE